MATAVLELPVRLAGYAVCLWGSISSHKNDGFTMSTLPFTKLHLRKLLLKSTVHNANRKKINSRTTTEPSFLNYCGKLGQAVTFLFEIYPCHMLFNAVTTVSPISLSEQSL